MKAISIKNPYAHLIYYGHKTLEVRSKPTQYRGNVLICVSQKEVYMWQIHNAKNLNFDNEIKELYKNSGQAICTAEIINCRPMQPNDEQESFVKYDSNMFVYELANIRTIQAFAVKGQLGLFNVDYNL